MAYRIQRLAYSTKTTKLLSKIKIPPYISYIFTGKLHLCMRYACEMHAHEVYARETHAHEVHAYEAHAMRYTPMRHTP